MIDLGQACSDPCLRRKLDAVVRDTTANLEDVVPHPWRRFCAQPMPDGQLWVADMMTLRFLSVEELRRLTTEELLQEFSRA